jgi:hypothetical protein
VLVTVAVIAKVPFIGTVCEVAGVVIETATEGGVGVLFAVAPQPTNTISRVKLIAKPNVV